jgi:diguanylate cyclase (GGDEF)-like protein
MVDGDETWRGGAMANTSPADERDGVAGSRDSSADARDTRADERDLTADLRDDNADLRDQAADKRDEVAQRSEHVGAAGIASETLVVSELVRLIARHDRRRAMADREASATGRSDAGRDRNAAIGDRDASATDRQASEADRGRAALDPLTGVFLRAAGFVQLEREIARSKRNGESLVVAFIDVDQLKVVNDTHGHSTGDELLVAVAAALRSHLRTEDLIFRYGGDEFVCAFVGLAATDATRRLDQVNRFLAKSTVFGSISIGLSELLPQDSPSDLTRRADAAMYSGRH